MRTEDSGGRRPPVGTRPTISTHVLDTERGLPAAGIRVTLYRLDVGGAPIRMTQALTDGDGRVRDLLERPLVAGRLPARVRRRPDEDDGRSSRRCRGRLRIADTSAELPRAAAARAVLDDDVPGQLSGRPRTCAAARRALAARGRVRVRRGVAPLVRGRAAVPRPARRGAPVRRRSDAVRGRAATIALAMPEDEQLELIDAHPRLGAPPATVSAASFREQGYDRDDAERRSRERAARRRAGAAQRRVRGALRLPVLRLRRRPSARGAVPVLGRRSRPTASARSGGRSATSSPSPATDTPGLPDAGGRVSRDRARRQPLRQVGDPARPGRRVAGRHTGPRPHGRRSPSRATSRPRTSTATTATWSRPTR